MRAELGLPRRIQDRGEFDFFTTNGKNTRIIESFRRRDEESRLPLISPIRESFGWNQKQTETSARNIQMLLRFFGLLGPNVPSKGHLLYTVITYHQVG